MASGPNKAGGTFLGLSYLEVSLENIGSFIHALVDGNNCPERKEECRSKNYPRKLWISLGIKGQPHCNNGGDAGQGAICLFFRQIKQAIES
jgi:hypothetical protein